MYKAQERISNQSNLSAAAQGGSFSVFNDKPLEYFWKHRQFALNCGYDY
jgi:hypothetical protein